MNNKNDKIQAGFTLIEVLIALMILAIALVAVMKATQDSIRDTSRVQDRITAQWVALNVISKMQVGLIPPPKAEAPTEDNANLLNQDWRWRALADSGAAAGYERITVEIYRKNDTAPITKLSGFINLTKENTNGTS